MSQKVGSTNHIIYPKQYFVPQDEGRIYDDRYNWCLGVNHLNQTIMFRMNMNIEKIAFDKETHKPYPIIGENLRVTSKRQGKVIPAIYNFEDMMEKNFFCISNENNSYENQNKDFGVILLSKSIEISGDQLLLAKENFKLDFGFDMPPCKVYECGYARVLNQGVPPLMSKINQEMLRKKSALPLFGLGRVEMRVKKVTEKNLIYSLSKSLPEMKGKYHDIKQHLINTRKKWKENIELKRLIKNNPNNEDLKIKQRNLLNEINQTKGIEHIRNFIRSSKAFSEYMELESDLKNINSVLTNQPESNNEVEKQKILEIREKMDYIAINNDIADFVVKIFDPSNIVETFFDVNDIVNKIENIYNNYTKEGSYAGAILRVFDNKGRTIPSLCIDFNCKFLGYNKLSKAKDDVQFKIDNDQKWRQIQKYLSYDLSFDILPYTYIKTPGPGKNSYKKISTSWIGNQSMNIPAMKSLYKDDLTNELKNTYIAVMRKGDKNQPGSSFVVNVIATGFNGEGPNEFEMDKNGKKGKIIRKR